MKHLKILLVCCFLCSTCILFAQSVDHRIVSGQYNQQKLPEILDDLEQRYSISFFYKKNWFPEQSFDLTFENVPLYQALNNLLDQTNLGFIPFRNDGIIIARQSDLTKAFTEDYYLAKYEEQLQAINQVNPNAERIIIGDSTNVDTDGSITILGTIKDRYSGDPMIGVTLFLEELQQGTATEVDGSFELEVPPGTYLLNIQAVGYREELRQLEVYSDDELNIELDVKSFQLEEVVVEAQADDQNVSSNQIGIKQLDAVELREIPSFLGEVDVIKSLLTLPGVTTVGEGAGGINVRGGNIDQNLIMQDGAMVFNSSHVLGFFSIFNSDAIEKVSLYKGHIPAQFGGRISAVLDVDTKDGNFEKVKGAGGLGLVSSRLMLEGPIFKNKTSFMVSGRVSYSDWLLRRVSIKEVQESSASFYDITAKLSQKIGANTNLSLSFYQSDDFFRFSREFGYDWQTRLLTFTWRQIYNTQLSSQTTAVAGRYQSGFFQPEGFDAFRLENGIDYYKVKHNFFFAPSEKHNFNAGVEWVSYDGQPEVLEPNSDQSTVIPDRVEKEQAQEWSAYADWEFNLNSSFAFSAGLRYTLFRNIGPGKVFLYEEGFPLSPDRIVDSTTFAKNELIQSYSGLEPRASMKIGLGATASIKLSYNHLLQYVHLISNTTATTPVDIWQMSNRFLEPQVADNYSLGFFKNFKKNMWETSAEFYYKNISQLVEYKDFADLFLNDNLETELLSGKGRSYGMELSINKATGNWTGTLSYTYSRTERQVAGNTPEESINVGEWFPANFDKPHQVTLLAKYKPNQKRTFSINFIYNTGRPITVPINSYQVDQVIIPNYSKRNQFRIPDFHRLDVSYTINSAVLKRKGFKGSLTFSIYNVYFRKNAYSVFFERNPTDFFPESFRLAVLGSAFPAITYNFRF